MRKTGNENTGQALFRKFPNLFGKIRLISVASWSEKSITINLRLRNFNLSLISLVLEISSQIICAMCAPNRINF